MEIGIFKAALSGLPKDRQRLQDLGGRKPMFTDEELIAMYEQNKAGTTWRTIHSVVGRCKSPQALNGAVLKCIKKLREERSGR